MFRRLIDSPWLYFALAGVLLVVTVLSQFQRVDVDAPSGGVEDIATLKERDDLNVIFILIDTLRADRLGTYGYERATSPNIDALAARGIRFDRVESQSSWTKASMASLWTGMYPARSGITRFSQALPTEAVLPAELFKEAGFRTAGIWRNGWVANNFGFDQGFDLYIKPSKSRPVRNVQRNNPSAHPLQGTDADVTESAIEFMLGSTTERFFLYLHYMDVHQYLYADTSPDWGSGFSDIYDSSIHWTDRNVGVLVDALKSEGLLDKTMIVISSDHGEAFFEHGAEGHAKDLYREVQHVPWIVVPPFALEQGIVVSERVANVDVWPTILDLLGLPEITGAEGKSLVPLVLATGRGEAPPSDLANRAVFSQLDRSWGREADPDPIISVVRDPYRMIQAELDPEQRELFDSSGDPLEKKNIAGRESTVADELSKVIEEFLVLENEQWGEAPEIELDEMKKAQLRALGYVVGGPPRPSKKKKKPAPEAVEAAPGS